MGSKYSPLLIGLIATIEVLHLGHDIPAAAQAIPHILGGPAFVAKVPNDDRAGVLDWGHNSRTGYLLHLRSMARSAAGTFLVALGTDQGRAGGLLISHKNSGAGIQLDQQAGAAIGMYLKGMSRSPLVAAEVYNGNPGISIKQMAGEAFDDFSFQAGSKIAFSQKASFTPSDIGALVTQTTSRGAGDALGALAPHTRIENVLSPNAIVLDRPALRSSRRTIVLVERLNTHRYRPVLDVESSTGVKNLSVSANGVATNRLQAIAEAGGGEALYIEDARGEARLRVSENGGVFISGSPSLPSSQIRPGDVTFHVSEKSGEAAIVFEARTPSGRLVRGRLKLE